MHKMEKDELDLFTESKISKTLTEMEISIRGARSWRTGSPQWTSRSRRKEPSGP